MTTQTQNVFISSLFGGGVAGFAVDVSLFPLDTLKTRLQSSQGFRKAGGFRAVYKGLGPQALGSVPMAALFFCTYETMKHFLIPKVTDSSLLPLVYITAASVAEVIACTIRVPVEIAKQRRQTMVGKLRQSSYAILREAYRQEGIRNGLYRGFGSTVMREIPFSALQFLVLEYLKVFYSYASGKNRLSSWDVAICGSIAGGFAAGFTTPLDVIKTRIMLADASVIKREHLTMRNVARIVYREGGIHGLFAGFVPRVLFITLGGAIFFGMYDLSKNSCDAFLTERNDAIRGVNTIS